MSEEIARAVADNLSDASEHIDAAEAAAAAARASLERAKTALVQREAERARLLEQTLKKSRGTK